MNVQNKGRLMSDVSIAEAVDAIDPRPILATLAGLTGERNFISPDFRRSPDPEIDADRIARARAFLQDYLCSLSGQETFSAAALKSGISESEIVEFVTDGASSAYDPAVIHGQLHGEIRTKTRISKKVAIIGGGLSGIAAAIELMADGCSVALFERNTQLGGTWAYNDYPGCRLDSNNFLYSYSFCPARRRSNYYSTQPEVLHYLQDVARNHGVDQVVTLGATVRECIWSEETGLWMLSVEKDGNVTHASFDAVVAALGQLGVPKLPDLPGLDRFSGPKLHANRWPKDVDLAGKRVGVIGTGATGFQLIPELAKTAKELVVFQRNPPWMVPTPEYSRPMPTSAAALFDILPGLSSWYRFWHFWIGVEGWLPLTEVDPSWKEAGSTSELNRWWRQTLVKHLEGRFSDRPDLLAKVVPSYPPGAKRMLRDDGTWPETLKQPHVKLEISRIASIIPEGVKLVGSKDVELDVLVFASGFAASEYLHGIKVVGRGGKEIHDFWKGEARAYMGSMVPGYPNFFLLYGPNTNLVASGSIVFMSECSVQFIASCLEQLSDRGARTIEVKSQAYSRFVTEMDEGNSRRAWSVVDNFYKNEFGKVTQVWPLSILEFWKRTRSIDERDVSFDM
ncbi:4-hydroxyacetophenone monooxygenase [Bradyrhizobium sp. CIR18]|uniref:flavin-containing monooxygenase n=1 Tax=Bradyrhizobium sp. CIR18 TaxID=2663839 RepID=UPI001605CEAB|nr:NAD(P)/FAD-dependent oxidoreductase [Bradyrhizobium sp. CIR18]MBB4367115.1 4-hydroxyacetophenone monooxygenase [Bradyrhizobium sp. CIR18]